MSSSSQKTNLTKERLKKRLNKIAPPEPVEDPNNIFEMLGKVSQILKNDPYLVNKVNSCVSKLIDNKDLMGILTEQIQTNLEKSETQTDIKVDEILKEQGIYDILDKRTEEFNKQAELKESKQ